MRDDILVWLDLETFGLERWHPILEVGIRVVDLDLNLLGVNSWLVWEDGYRQNVSTAAAAQDQWVYRTHSNNGLFAEASEDGLRRIEVAHLAAKWLQAEGFDGQPMCGSSVHADRAWLDQQMPQLLKAFHYRIIDNSTIKELCRRYNPEVYKQAPPKTEQHRVGPDLIESIEEFRFYRNEFLLWD